MDDRQVTVGDLEEILRPLAKTSEVKVHVFHHERRHEVMRTAPSVAPDRHLDFVVDMVRSEEGR